MKFIESQICKSKSHCGICRQKDGGREWRVLVGRIHPIDSPDFECPDGLPWIGGEPSAVMKKAFAPEKSGGNLRRQAAARRLAMGKALRHNAIELKKRLSPDSPIVKMLHKIEQSDKRGGCRGCRARKLLRKLGLAFESSSDSDKEIVQEILEV